MKKNAKKKSGYFTHGEIALWCLSVTLILVSFILFDREKYMTLIASLIGVTSLIFNAKGNPIGQALTVVFSVLYGIISFRFAYYGEMITYLGMTMPMAIVALVAWLRHPYRGRRAEVEINRLRGGEIVFMLLLTAAVTFVFYFILRAFHTANLFPSTISVMTSFLAVYLTFRRSAFYAVAYAANDVVLIVLWAMAATLDFTCISVIICFAMFLLNDVYGFVSWSGMKKRQAADRERVSEKAL